MGRQGGLYRDLMTRPSPFEAGLLYCVTLWLHSGTHGFSFTVFFSHLPREIEDRQGCTKVKDIPKTYIDSPNIDISSPSPLPLLL